MKKFGVISDIHGYPPTEEHKKLLSDCSIFCICGDIFEGKSMNALSNKKILEWLKTLTSNGTRVVGIPGNHDLMLYRGWLEKNNRHPLDTYCDGIYTVNSVSQEEIKEACGMDLLIDEGIEIDGKHIWGSPWSPRFCNWAFMLEEDDLYEKFSKMPKDTDVLLVHTPPAPEWDTNAPKFWNIDVSDYDRTKHLGSNALTRAIKENLESADVFCGHIHSGSHDDGAFYLPHDNLCINVSYVNERYTPFYEPYIFYY